jgi:ferredoxin
MRITADRDRCAGAGMCALTAPGVFDQDDLEGLVVVLNAEPQAEDANEAANAIELCPSGALTITEQ